MVFRPSLARSELEVIRIVWRLKSATVREVLDQLPAERALDFKTVQTYLRRLEQKGYLTSVKQGRTRVYRQRAQPKTVVRELVRDFVDRLFDGDPLPLLQNLVQEHGVTQDDLRELRELTQSQESNDVADPS